MMMDFLKGVAIGFTIAAAAGLIGVIWNTLVEDWRNRK